PPHPCSYFPHKTAAFRAFQAESLPAYIYHRLMDAGFRRSGQLLYQPACPGCRECRPIRVPTAAFVPSKSQQRILRKNADLQIHIAPPDPSTEKYQLFSRYQTEWHNRDHSHEADDVGSFIAFLYQSPVDSLEFEYRDAGG